MCEIISEYVTAGLVEHIGVSVYSPQKARDALERNGVDIVQVPSNILDRRFECADIFQIASDKGKQIYVRSVFLNGLVLMNSSDVPSNMQFAVSAMKMLESVALERGLKKGGTLGKRMVKKKSSDHYILKFLTRESIKSKDRYESI